MLIWIKENIATLIVGLILLGIVLSIIVRLIARKKAGKCITCDSCDKCNKPCHLKNNKE